MGVYKYYNSYIAQGTTVGSNYPNLGDVELIRDPLDVKSVNNSYYYYSVCR